VRAALLVLVSSALAAALAPGSSSVPTTPAEDVRLLGEMIESVHPEPFRAVTRARFRSEVSAAARRAPGLDQNERLVDLLRVVALLGVRNGHTGIFPLDSGNLRQPHLYPLRLYRFSDGLFVIDEAGDLGLVGSRLVAVDGRPIADVLARVRPLVPRDNESHLRGLAPHYLLVAEVLDGLGLVDGTGEADLTFEAAGGVRVTRSLAPIAAADYRAAFADPIFGHYPAALPRAPKPLYLAGSDKRLWARTLEGGKAVYVGFNSVRLPSSAILRKIERLVRGPKVRRVVVDVRLNGGGDNTTYAGLVGIFTSPRVDKQGRLYLLTGRATFSAAGNFAAEIDRDTRATIVGEPTGGGVETYGDTTAVLLPANGLYVHVAAEYHERRRGSRDRRLAVGPDVRVDLASRDYFAGRDPVLERALRGL
jgi:Peptidase family S41